MPADDGFFMISVTLPAFAVSVERVEPQRAAGIGAEVDHLALAERGRRRARGAGGGAVEVVLLPPQPASRATPTTETQMMGRNLDMP